MGFLQERCWPGGIPNSPGTPGALLLNLPPIAFSCWTKHHLGVPRSITLLFLVGSKGGLPLQPASNCGYHPKKKAQIPHSPPENPRDQNPWLSAGWQATQISPRNTYLSAPRNSGRRCPCQVPAAPIAIKDTQFFAHNTEWHRLRSREQLATLSGDLPHTVKRQREAVVLYARKGWKERRTWKHLSV